MRSDGRGPWYLLTGVILGIALGLVYAWMIAPVKYVDTVPHMLRADYQDQYRALVAAAYMASGDLARAEARLRELHDPEVARTVAIQAQQALAEGRPEAETRALGMLAAALGQGPAPVTAAPQATMTPETSEVVTTTAQTPTPLLLTDTPVVPTETLVPTQRLPQSTSTPLPTRTASPTPGAPFILLEQTLVCNPNLGQSLIQVQALDAAGQPVPGVEALVAWVDSQGVAFEEHFFTGMKPELGLGYADFVMTPGLTYTLRMADGGQPTPDLTPAECEVEGGERYWGSWLLTFVQP